MIDKRIRLIVCEQEQYDAWKKDEMFLDMNLNQLVDPVHGLALREKVLKYVIKNLGRFDYEPKYFWELSNYEKRQGAITYEEFKEMTIHVDKKILNNVVSLVVTDVR